MFPAGKHFKMDTVLSSPLAVSEAYSPQLCYDHQKEAECRVQESRPYING